jgi:two-component system sensor histidine kinase BaeS
MPQGLIAKLFSSVLLVTVFIVVAMGFAARVTFNEGFLGYLAKQEEIRLKETVPLLADAYRAHGSWRFIRDDPQNWIVLMRPANLPDHPTVEDIENTALSVSDLTGVPMRFTLLDAQQRYVFGNPKTGFGAPKLPIVVDGRTVGWLRMLPFQRVIEAGDLAFQRSQHRGFFIIGISALLLAALLTIAVARSLLGPISHLKRATDAVAIGDYAIRVHENNRDELGQLAKNFNRMAHVLESNEKMRREFVADVSHELRTPLAVMHAEFEVLEDGIRPIDIAAIQSLKVEATHLSKLVEDLYQLSLADIGALIYRKSDVDMTELLRTTTEAFQKRLVQAGITLELKLPQSPLTLYADDKRLRQLFANLLENSIRYTHAGGRLSIYCMQLENQVAIDVMDSAPGVDDTGLARLFDRFYRGESSRNRASGGAGLGLPISRSIVEAHGGSIEAKHSRLGGLWLVIRLPIGDA